LADDAAVNEAPDEKIGRDRLDRILEAAQQAFMTHGYHGATTDMIQAAAAVSKSTLYRYFPTKEDLFKAAFEAYSKDFLTSIGQIYKDNDDVETFLFQFGLEFIEALVSPKGRNLFRLMVAEGQRFPQVGKMFYIVGPKVTTDLVENYLANAHNRGAVRVENPAMAAEHFIGMIRGDLFLRCLLGASLPPSRAQLERFVRATVSAFLAAYRA
jgi:TetR/AcrR family transcriptional repressor of mexJK operon